MAFQDFDFISERRKQEKKQKLKKRITVGIISLVLIAGIVVAAIFVTQDIKKDETTNKSNSSQPKEKDSKSEKMVKTICGPTDYEATCKSKLAKAVKSNQSPQFKDLLKAAISVVSDEINKAMEQASKLKLDTPEKKKAFEVCKEVIEDAKDELNSSVTMVNGKDFGKLSVKTPDLENWLSAVMSYQQTCIDAIPDGEVKTSMQKAFKTAKELTSNSLAIVSQVSSILSTVQKDHRRRRLLSNTPYSSIPSLKTGDFPTWMSSEDRRMLKADAPKDPPNVVVAKDGSGNFSTINAALAVLPEKYQGRYIIYVKEGVYDETVEITKKMVNVTMYGDGSQKSIITGNKNFVDGVQTFKTATFAAIGEGFMAQSLGFRNTAGPEKHQAVALRVQSDRSIFLNCRMEGYQDTLYVQTHRQFYRGCLITGTIDFIFGDAAAIFQNCNIYIRKPMDNQKNIVTAQGRVNKRETTGIVLQNCHIMADDKLAPEKAKFKSYLGRPWKEYSRTILLETEIDDIIDPAGWLEWDGSFALKTLYYAEYNDKGPGAELKGRVKWPGVKVINKDDALKFTVGPFLEGESWLKGDIGVPVRFNLAG